MYEVPNKPFTLETIKEFNKFLFPHINWDKDEEKVLEINANEDVNTDDGLV